MLSVLDIFKIGIGPSSSHTMGPMNAARQFASDLEARGVLTRTRQVSAELFGSLGLTGLGHCTDRAILLGLEGHRPESIEAGAIEPILARVREQKHLSLLGVHQIAFDEASDVCFHRSQVLTAHPNGMRFTARASLGEVLYEEEFYSIGGGFVLRAAEFQQSSSAAPQVKVRYPFESASELLQLVRENDLTIHELVSVNERAWRGDGETRTALLRI